MNPPSSSISGARAAAILAGAAAATLVAGVVALELVFGTWLSHNPWDRALALNIIVGRRMVFDASSLYPGGGSVVDTRDRYGLRGDFGDPRNISILTVGGSTTEQRYIADGATWQDVLEHQLRADGHDVRVANAGVDGHSTFGHLMAYRYWFPLVPGLKPRYTVLYVGLNDLFLGKPREVFEGSGNGTATLKSRIKANSALYRLYALIRGTLLAHKLGVDHHPTDFAKVTWVDKGLMKDSGPLSRRLAAQFGERLAMLLAQVRKTGSRPVCVTQPSLFSRVAPDGTVRGTSLRIPVPLDEPLNGVDFHRFDVAYDTVMKATCGAAGAPVVDMAEAPWDDSDFYDYVHFNPTGAAKFGARLAAAMNGFAW